MFKLKLRVVVCDVFFILHWLTIEVILKETVLEILVVGSLFPLMFYVVVIVLLETEF